MAKRAKEILSDIATTEPTQNIAFFDNDTKKISQITNPLKGMVEIKKEGRDINLRGRCRPTFVSIRLGHKSYI